MTETVQQSSNSPGLRSVAPAPESRRLRFVDVVPPGAALRREFAQPRRCMAVEEPASMQAIALEAAAADLSAQCFLLFPSKQTLVEAKHNGWLPAALQNGEAGSVQVKREAEWIRWLPGIAVVQCRAENREAIVEALVEFSFYERELRALEQKLELAQRDADQDIEVGHRVKQRDRRQWPRLFDAGERLCRLRLEFARLEPLLGEPSRTLPSLARKWLFRLLRRANVETRLEALDDKLETLEAFYEAATQRIAEYRWYREGHLLEVGILLLLLLECGLMGGDVYLHLRHEQLPAETRSAQ